MIFKGLPALNKSRNRKNVWEVCNQISLLPIRRVCHKSVSGVGKRWGRLPGHKSKKLRLFYSISTFQNERFKLSEIPTSRELLSIKDRPKRCTISTTLSQIFTKIRQIVRIFTTCVSV